MKPSLVGMDQGNNFRFVRHLKKVKHSSDHQIMRWLENKKNAAETEGLLDALRAHKWITKKS